MTTTVSRGGQRLRGLTIGDLSIMVGYSTLVIPTLVSLADQSWSREFGAYGPIVLVTGLWLLWRQVPDMRRTARPGSPWITAAILVVSLAFYAFGRAFDFLTFETGGDYGVAIAILYDRLGAKSLLNHWFPLLYLAFVIPPPNLVLADITAPLKQLVSYAATNGLYAFGIPVSREGVTIFVAQYQLLVEDACSGMNSIVGLIAVSLLYIYLMRGSSVFYSIFLTVFVVPIAIIANIFRIMILILLTYFFGNEVAQGILHFTAGMLLFATALLCVFGLDQLVTYVRGNMAKSA